MPGEARLAFFGRKFSTTRRIIIAAVCQPLAIRPPKRPRPCRLGVDMHVLRVEAAGKVEDFGLVDPDLAVLEYRARYVVLEVSLFGQ